MDEISFYLARHLESLQVNLQWGLSQTRQLSIAWGSVAQHQWDFVYNLQWTDSLKQASAVVRNFIREAFTVMAQPTEMYNQLYELVRIEMPILYPGGAGFVTGAVIGVIIGLSIQNSTPPPQRMKAVVAMSYDSLDSVICLEDLIMPSVVKKNQVLIQVKAASVDIVDIRICAGYGRTIRRLFGYNGPNMKDGLPVTLGRDCSGVVVDIGPGVQKLDIGDEVWAVSPFWASGTISDFVLLDENYVNKKPKSVGFEGAASLPYSGCLAYAACVKAGIIGADPGKRVLIQNGVSPVGCIVSQIAKMYGCEVTVTCSTLGASVARALGATEVITYGQIELENQLAKDRFDVVLNTVGGVSYESCKMLCKPDGVLVSTVPPVLPSDSYAFPASYLHGMKLRLQSAFKGLVGQPNTWTDVEFSSSLLESLASLVDEGKIYPVVDKIFSPQDAVLALQHCDSVNAIGKTVIRFRNKSAAESKKKIAGMYVTSL